MINEQEEFEQYTGAPVYTAKNKQDSAYLGRFTFDMILKGEGMARVLTIIARGFYWRSGCDADYTRRALCAWCSIPDTGKTAPKEDWQYPSDFRDLHDEFPELVNEHGGGWFYRHVHGIADFISCNPDWVSKAACANADIISTKWDEHWRKKVVQLQIPIFLPETKGAWVMRFDDVIADAAEQGALRGTDVVLPELLISAAAQLAPDVRPDVIEALVKYYIANKPDDSDWVVLPVSNFDAYFGTTSFSRKWLAMIPETVIERQKQCLGVSRYRLGEGIAGLVNGRTVPSVAARQVIRLSNTSRRSVTRANVKMD